MVIDITVVLDPVKEADLVAAYEKAEDWVCTKKTTVSVTFHRKYINFIGDAFMGTEDGT